jgi:dTDP-4-amino-4,6-dideoxygalactose transaminase
MKIPFNKPYITGADISIQQMARQTKTVAGNGWYTNKCQRFFEKRFKFRKCLLTNSCSDALEMSALLAGIKPGDEVIMPSFTFTSTANAFLLRGAKVVFADVSDDIPNIEPERITELISPATKAIVVVHYSGIACQMDEIMKIAASHNLFVIEDAAHAVDAYYKGRALGSIGQFGTFSFHETKNIISGEGGMLTINEERFFRQAEIAWEKGTNRAAFHRGEVDKYQWMGLGSSYLPSELTAGFLYTQLNEFDKIQRRRKHIWHYYYQALLPLQQAGHFRLPVIPDYAGVNGNMFYLVMPSPETRNQLLRYLSKKGVHAVFHYLPLHASPFYANEHGHRPMPNTDMFSSCLLRLPFFVELEQNQQDYIISKLTSFYKA